VDSAYGKLRKLSDDCKASENEFDYFWKTAVQLTLQHATILSTKPSTR
jgi:hypothetical protein